jgi:hypothetical protein
MLIKLAEKLAIYDRFMESSNSAKFGLNQISGGVSMQLLNIVKTASLSLLCFSGSRRGQIRGPILMQNGSKDAE